MFCQTTFDPWRSTIMTHLPHLSKTQVTGLALWSRRYGPGAVVRPIGGQRLSGSPSFSQRGSARRNP